MKELKTYISEGFFSNVGANNIIKPVIDLIKDASMNNKIDSSEKKLKFANLLLPILKDIENNMKKGKIVLEYIRNDEKFAKSKSKTIISFETSGLNEAKWTYINNINNLGELKVDVSAIATRISMDLYYEAKFLPQNPKLHHSIANTIKVTEFKIS